MAEAIIKRDGFSIYIDAVINLIVFYVYPEYNETYDGDCDQKQDGFREIIISQ